MDISALTTVFTSGTLASMLDVPANYLMSGGKRMVEALEWVHNKGFVHMDVKASNDFISKLAFSAWRLWLFSPTCTQGDNIFLDAEGNWYLGDFGSAVMEGENVETVSPWFAPEANLTGRPSKKGYDWCVPLVHTQCSTQLTHCLPLSTLLQAHVGGGVGVRAQ
jgi:serine/threonine protein kinase